MVPRALFVALLIFGCSLLATSRRVNLKMTPSAESTSSIVIAPGKKKKKKSASSKEEHKTAPKLNLNQDLSNPSQKRDLETPEEMSKDLAAAAPKLKVSLKMPEDMKEIFPKLNPDDVIKNLKAHFPELNVTWKTGEDMIKDLGVETVPKPDVNLKQDLSEPSLKEDAISGKSSTPTEEMIEELAAVFPGLMSTEDMVKNLGRATVVPIVSKSSQKSEATGGKTGDMIKDLAAAFDGVKTAEDMVKNFGVATVVPPGLNVKQDLSKSIQKSDVFSGESSMTHEDIVKDLTATFPNSMMINLGVAEVVPKLGPNVKQDLSKTSQNSDATNGKTGDMIKDLAAAFNGVKTTADMVKNLGVAAVVPPGLNVKQDLSKSSQKSDAIGGKTEDIINGLSALFPGLKSTEDMVKNLGVATVVLKQGPNLKQDLSKSSQKSDATSGKMPTTTEEMIEELAAAFPKLITDFKRSKDMVKDLSKPSLEGDTISGESLKATEGTVKNLAATFQMIKDLAATVQMTSLELRIWQSRFGRDVFEKAENVMQTIAAPFVAIVTKSSTDFVIVGASTQMTKKLLVEYLQLRGASQAQITQSAEKFFRQHEQLTFSQFVQESLGHHDLFSRTFIEVLPL